MAAVAMAGESYSSPLAHKGHVQKCILPLAPPEVMRSREQSFVNDAVKTVVYNVPRKIPIIPHYDSLLDRQSRKYFESSLVQGIIDITRGNKEQPERDPARNLNKLSVRGRCPPSPRPDVLSAREDSYVNDAVPAFKARTLYNDTLLPKYDGAHDTHCKSYFDRKNVQDMLRVQKVRELPVQSRRHRPLTPLATTVPPLQLCTSPRASRSQETPRSKNNTSGPKREKTIYRSSDRGSKKTTPRGYENTPLAESPRLGPDPNNPNKLSYRGICIPTPDGREIQERERGFVNDAVVTSSRRTRFSDIIPPYDAADDRSCRGYFQRRDVQRLCSVTCTVKPLENGGTSIEGAVQDRFDTTGPGFQYVTLRNQFGAGHSRDSIDGHAQFMKGVKPVLGYNGDYGYRRNTPWLRASPSPFGTASTSPTH